MADIFALLLDSNCLCTFDFAEGQLVPWRGEEFTRNADYYILHPTTSDATHSNADARQASHAHSGSSDSANSRHIERLAQRLFGKMHSKPQIGEVAKILFRLEKLMVPIERDGQQKSIHALEFKDGNVNVAVALIERNQRNQLACMLKSVLECSHAIEQQLLFRLSTEPNMPPFLYELLHIQPPTEPNLIRIRNFDYITPEEHRFLHPDQQNAPTSKHCAILDQPLDDYGEMLHHIKIILTPEQSQIGIPTNTLKFKQFCHRPNAPLYPQMFSRSNTSEYNQSMEQKVDEHQEEYLLSRILKKQRMFASPSVLNKSRTRLQIPHLEAEEEYAQTSDAEMTISQLNDALQELHSDPDLASSFSPQSSRSHMSFISSTA